MASVFINYQTHADILQKSRHTVRSTLEECPIMDLSIHRGHSVSLSVDSQRKIQKAFFDIFDILELLISLSNATFHYVLRLRHEPCILAPVDFIINDTDMAENIIFSG